MTRLTNRHALFASLALVLVASITHVAASFSVLEPGHVVGWIAAVAVDIGIASLIWRLVGGEPRGRWWALAGVVIMAGVSAWANLDAALTVAAAGTGASSVLTAWHADAYWQVARVVILSVTLPALTVVLAAVAHSDAAPVKERKPRTRKADAPAMPDPLPGMWTTYGPHVAHGADHAPHVPAVPPARPAVPDVLSIALAEPWRTNADIARRAGVDASRVSRKLKAAGIVRDRATGVLVEPLPATTTAGRNGAHADA